MKNTNIIVNTLIIFLFTLLTIAGIISYKSIDWDVLKIMEQQKVVLPTSVSQTPISTISTTASTSSSKK